MSKISDRLRASAALVEATKDWPKTPIERTMHDLMVEIAKQLTEGAAEIDRLELEIAVPSEDSLHDLEI